jgi:two-component system, NtrC family, response regulator AlgB
VIARREPARVQEEPESLEYVERAHVRRILAESTSLSVAAARLGIDLTTLWRKRKRWGLA